MNEYKQYNYSGASLFAKISVLLGIFFIMLIACGACISIISVLNISERTNALIAAALQAILVFILPSLIYSRVFYSSPLKSLSLDRPINFKEIFGILLIFIIALPALNQVIFWNESVTLPSSLNGLEKVLRTMEDSAMEATGILLNTKSIGGLISGVLIIGVLTGFAEELFFRGALQKTLIHSSLKPVVAIWVTAFIFSAIHFQFYGFIPRLLLGAFFGYLLLWTKSIWVSAFAHAFNNSIVVIFAWLNENGILNVNPEKIGVVENGLPWVAIGSACLLIITLKLGKDYFFQKTE